MRTSKATTAFLSKFSSYIGKFKETSTVSVAHEQIRKLFSEHKFSDIAIAWVSKMDSCEQLSEKEKKEHVKIYISLMDAYGQDIIFEHYDRIIESIAKKNVGVSEVVGHLCRTLLRRIYPAENITNYIRHLLGAFERNSELGKILKQIAESFDPDILAPIQSEIVGIISERMTHNLRNPVKLEYIEAILAIVLTLESKFIEELAIQQLLVKNFQSEEWGIRKVCIDISYALFVVRTEVNSVLHSHVIELKYDKIKHVRDSANNYTTLYKQIYGEDKVKGKVEKTGNRSSFLESKKGIVKNQSKLRSATEEEQKISSKSIEKQSRGISRNEDFFQNAGNSDVIKIPESKSIVAESNVINKELESQSRSKENRELLSNSPLERENLKITDVSFEYEKEEIEGEVNFEQYLKNRPKTSHISFSPVHEVNNSIEAKSKNLNKPSPKENEHFEKEFNKKFKAEIRKQELPYKEESENIELPKIEMEMTKTILEQFSKLQNSMQKLSDELLTRMDHLERRVSKLEDQKHYEEDMSLSSLHRDIKEMKNEMNSQFYVQDSFSNKFNDLHNNSSLYEKERKVQYSRNDNLSGSKQTSRSTPPESNLSLKIQESLQTNNWNEAFSLAIANNSKVDLIDLLKYNQIPEDKLVQDCLLVELRRNLDNWVVIKWLLHFLQEFNVSVEKMEKLENDVKRAEIKMEGNSQEELRNYNMYRGLLLNELNSKIEDYGRYPGGMTKNQM